MHRWTRIAAIFLALLTPVVASANVVPGTTEAQFTIGPDGSANYAMPIKVSPGTAGLEPRLSLTYSSRAGVGVAGIGWSISGLSAIQRGARNLPDDGVVRGVHFDPQDALLFDGEKLVEVEPTTGSATREYRTRTDSLSRVIADGWNDQGPTSFTAQTRAGLVLQFGKSADSLVRMSNGKVLLWLCNRVEDRSGNYLSITYASSNTEYRVVKIAYTGNDKAIPGLVPYADVTFEYTNVAPQETRYVLGERTGTTFLLSAINSRYGSRLYRRYALTHSVLPSRSAYRLDQIVEIGGDGETQFRPLVFKYAEQSAGNVWKQFDHLKLPSDINFAVAADTRAGFRFFDVDGDARVDVVYRTKLESEIRSGTYVHENGEWVKKPVLSAPIDLAVGGTTDTSVRAFDADGKAGEDLVSTGSNGGTYLGTSAGWVTVNSRPPVPFEREGVADPGVLIFDVDRSAKNGKEILYSSTQAGSGASHFDGTTWMAVPAKAPPRPLLPDGAEESGAFSVDVDCDGQDELAYHRKLPNGTVESVVYAIKTGTWSEVTDPKFGIPIGTVPSERAFRLADLNGDGCLDILAAFVDGATVTRAAFLASATGWKLDARSPPNVDFWRDGSPTDAWLTDLDGDQRADIMIGTIDSAGLAYLGQSSGWKEEPGLVPPAQLGLQGAGSSGRGQALHLAGAAASQLVYLTKPTADSNLRLVYEIATADMTWQASDRYTIPVVIAKFDKMDLGVRFPDMNGDGLADIAFTRKSGNALSKHAYIFQPDGNIGSAWSKDTKFEIPVATFSDDFKDTGVALADFNGDGLVDVLQSYREQNGALTQKLLVNCFRTNQCIGTSTNASIWGEVSNWDVPKEAFASVDEGGLGVRILDINGDGRTDIAVARADPTSEKPLYAKTYLHTGTGWKEATSLASPIDFVRSLQPSEGAGLGTTMRDNRVEFVDLDGDRLPDLLYRFKTWRRKVPEDPNNPPPPNQPPEMEEVEVLGAKLNRGDRWVDAPNYAPPGRLDDIEGRNLRQVYLQDVNGDALVDLVLAEKTKSQIYLNTGAGWTNSHGFVLNDDALSPIDGDQGFRFMDVNADGLPDVSYSYKRDGASEPTRGTFLNSGTSFVVADRRFDPPREVQYTEEHRGDIGLRPLDLNGDGVVDLAQSYDRTADQEQNRVWLNVAAPRGAMPHLMVSATNGLGVANEVTYRSLIGYEPEADLQGLSAPGEIASKRSTYPVIDAPVPGQVVIEARIAVPGYDARRNRYQYGIYRVEADSGRSLGFSWQTVLDVDRNRTTRIDYSQSDGAIGTPVRTTILQGRRLVSQTDNLWNVRMRQGMQIWNGHKPRVLSTQLARTSSQSFDLNGDLVAKQSDAFTYDDNSNVVRVETTFGDGSVSLSENVFSDDRSRWLLSRLSKATVTLTAPTCVPDGSCPHTGPTSETRIASFEYDSETGLLSHERSLVGTALQLDVAYQRDQYGNKIGTVTQPADSPRDVRRDSLTFDANGRFVIAASNALEHSATSVYDLATGMPVRATDPNGQTTLYRYDSLQRLVWERNPAGVESTTSLEFPDRSGGGLFATMIRKVVGTLPESRSYSDALGRVILQRSTGFGGRFVSVESVYDSLGRRSKISLPHFDDDAAHWTEYLYDSVDRVIREHRPDGSEFHVEHQGLITTQIDANGNRTTRKVDLRGRVAQTVDPLGGVTSFSYDVSGNQTVLRNAIGLEVNLSYDIAGNRVALEDPSAGRWSYTYDAFSQLRTQKDPNGNVLNLDYDQLGRITQRRVGGQVTHWTYDRGERALGMLVEVSSSMQSRKTYAYDAFGRLAHATAAFGRDELTIDQTYDSLGRPSARRYSTGVTLERSYDNEGFWRAVRLQAREDSRDVWRGEGIDAAGRIVKESFGDGIDVTRTFDEQSGRLLFQDAYGSDAASGPLQHLSQSFDKLGNLLTRQDMAADRMERFGYDALSRLVSVSGSNQVQVRYDALGNILEKSGVGIYQYCDDEGPQRALCAIQSSDGAVEQFKYDLAGNVIQSGKHSLQYDLEGRASRIRRSSLSYAEFQYGTDGEIVRHENREREVKFTAIYLADVEILREEFAPPSFPTPERTRIRNYIESPSGAVAYFEHTYWHYPMRDASPIYGDRLIQMPQRSTRLTTKLTYLITDGLGSIQATVDEKGKLLERFMYDPWGKRQEINSKQGYTDMRRGFTGHEQVDNLGFVHMGGRVYDPGVGRFTSVDPFMQSPGFSQSHNRYAYAFNNPLRYVDPTGYFFGGIVDAVRGALGSVGRALGAIYDATVGRPLRWIGEQLQKAGRWFSQNWRTVVVIAACAALSATGIGAIAVGAIAGGLQAALHGGTIDDVIRGAAIGAISGALTMGAGAISAGSATGSVLAHGVSSGMSNVIATNDQGSFWSGFGTGAVANLASPYVEEAGNAGYGPAAAAASGGVASAVGGGSFENGAIFGAFRRCFTENAQGRPSAVASLVGKIWNLPNTLVGVLYASAGYAAGKAGYALGLSTEEPSFKLDSNAIASIYNPFGGVGAITLGNVVTYSDNGKQMAPHENAHTFQGQTLGPLYLPANIIGGMASVIPSLLSPGVPTTWHGPQNFMETGPEQHRPW